MPAPDLQTQAHAASITSPTSFWAAQAQHLTWTTAPRTILAQPPRTLPSSTTTTTHPSWSWFPDGEINTSTNCLDRHVAAGHGDAVAIVYDSPVTQTVQKITYAQLLDQVELLAAVLVDEGVKKGDAVLVYMPMIPAAITALLALTRIGAIHAVVFGGFAGQALAQRIEASGAVMVMTASCGIEGARKGPVSYQPMVREAVGKSRVKPRRVLVWQRPELRWDGLDVGAGERNWGKLVRSAKGRGRRQGAVAVRGDEPVYVIYTSGTTGTPKGVVRANAGHLVGLNFTIRYIFGVRGPGDVIFTASDIGWVVGHCYIVYAPLLAGATTVLFEGKPVGTPNAGTFWRILREHRVNVMFTAPTALRAIRREDPDSKHFKEAARDNGLRHVRALFLAGERSEPAIITQYARLLQDHCAPRAQVVDNWWSSESGSPITSVALMPSTAQSWNTSEETARVTPSKPGAAGKPMPGFDVRVVDDDGKEVPENSMGNIVLGLPLAPTGMTTLWNDDARFYSSYLKRFQGQWVDTGDAGRIDPEGFVHVMSRSDDIINVAAHRFSTSTIEQAITTHPAVAEAGVVGIPDELKGHLPFAFVTLNLADHPSSAIPDKKLLDEVQALVRQQIGAIAALGGMIQGKGMIPKTRSGKTLRRVLRELVENAVHGSFNKPVQVPATIEDLSVVDVARAKVQEYFVQRGHSHKAIESKL